jgi:hypothetical protein
MIPTAHAAGVISDAPRVSEMLLNVFEFLLSIVGILGIVGLVIAGLLYLAAAGDEKLAKTAKKASVASVVGMVLAFGVWVVLKTLAGFFA